jgi:hypothetical protein
VQLMYCNSLESNRAFRAFEHIRNEVDPCALSRLDIHETYPRSIIKPVLFVYSSCIRWGATRILVVGFIAASFDAATASRTASTETIPRVGRWNTSLCETIRVAY